MSLSYKCVLLVLVIMQVNNVAVIYKDVKHANLRVRPNKEVILTVPLNMTNGEIKYILNKRADWIKKQLVLFNQNEPIKRELVSGENFVYLGKNYRLKVIEAQEERVKLNRGYFELYVKDKQHYTKKEKLIESWYKTKAAVHFQKTIEKYQPIVKKDIKTIRIRSMKTRWGSCNPKKSYINLNLELIKKSKASIEYVVFHELTHLIHHNHSAKFYNYLTLHMPDWKKRKLILDNQ